MTRQYGTPPFRAAAVHGGPGGIGSAGGLAAGLSAACGVLEPLQSKYTVSELVEELQEQLSAVPEPLVLIGHSWGAWLALLYAAKHPERVKRLVAVGCPSLEAKYVPQLGQRRLARLSQADRERCRFLTEELARNNDSALLRELGELCGRADDYAPIPDLTEPGSSFDGRMYSEIWDEADAMRRSRELLSRAAALTIPVTVIHGEVDPHPPEGVIEPLTQVGIPFDLHLLPRCGHTPWREIHARAEFFAALSAIV